jgi:hypothetical protein
VKWRFLGAFRRDAPGSDVNLPPGWHRDPGNPARRYRDMRSGTGTVTVTHFSGSASLGNPGGAGGSGSVNEAVRVCTVEENGQ